MKEFVQRYGRLISIVVMAVQVIVILTVVWNIFPFLIWCCAAAAGAAWLSLWTEAAWRL